MAISDKRVNRESRGLLDLFRAKVGGKGPFEFSQEIRPVIDDLPFLASASIVTNSAFQSGTTAANVSISVPSDETWLVWQAMASCEGAASQSTVAQSAYGYLAFGNIPTASGGGSADAILKYWEYASTSQEGTAQARAVSAVWVPGHPFLLPPSSTVKNVMTAKNGTAQTVTSRVYCLYSRLKV